MAAPNQTKPARIRAYPWAIFALLVLASLAGGCLDAGRGHSTSFVVERVESDQFVEFSAQELGSSPALRFLGEALENATRGQTRTDISGRSEAASEALRVVDTEWKEKYGPDAVTGRQVRYEGTVYRVNILIQ